VACLEELRNEVLARDGEFDAPMTEHVTCDCCLLDCTVDYYSTAVSQSRGENITTEQFDICPLCFQEVDSKAVAGSSEKAAAVHYVDGQPCAGS
jgi:hypothetical protein